MSISAKIGRLSPPIAALLLLGACAGPYGPGGGPGYAGGPYSMRPYPIPYRPPYRPQMPTGERDLPPSALPLRDPPAISPVVAPQPPVAPAPIPAPKLPVRVRDPEPDPWQDLDALRPVDPSCGHWWR